MIMWKKLSKHFALLVICLLMLIFVIFPYGLSRLFRRLTLNAYLNNEYHLLCDEMKINYMQIYEGYMEIDIGGGLVLMKLAFHL